MNRQFSILAGLVLIALGALSLLSNFTLMVFGFDLGRYVAGLVWSPFVIALGLLFVATPIFTRNEPAAGGLFIPGMPILATGIVMLLATLMPWWHIWARLWPMIILGLAAGFVCMALYMRNAWIVIPAIFIGLNGLVLQFCALTGLWSAWAVLWAVEPLAVGFTLLLTAAKTRSTAVFVVGLVFCAFSCTALMGMAVLVTGLWRLMGVMSAAGLIMAGLALLAWNLFKPHHPAAAPTGSQA
jgi:hypothetical protein